MDEHIRRLREEEDAARTRLAIALDDYAAALRIRDDERAQKAAGRAMRLAEDHERTKARVRGAEAMTARDVRIVAASDGLDGAA